MLMVGRVYMLANHKSLCSPSEPKCTKCANWANARTNKLNAKGRIFFMIFEWFLQIFPLKDMLVSKKHVKKEYKGSINIFAAIKVRSTKKKNRKPPGIFTRMFYGRYFASIIIIKHRQKSGCKEMAFIVKNLAVIKGGLWLWRVFVVGLIDFCEAMVREWSAAKCR